MNATELASLLEVDSWYKLVTREEIATTLRAQQAEIESLKKRCLDEIFKTTYADRSAEVMCEQWEKAQAEIEALKLQLHTTLTNRDLRTYDGKLE